MPNSFREITLPGGRIVRVQCAAPLALEAPSAGEDWKTINGAHVLLDGEGRVTKGPKHLMGKSVDEIHAHGKAAPSEKAKPGYHRIERNAVGGYVGTHGKEGLTHVPEHEERLKKLGVSPGYQKIHLAEDPQAMLQVHQTSASGLETRVYSDEHHAKQKKIKHARVNEFRKILPEVEKSIANDPSEEAAVLRLIRPTGIRQGSETDTKAKQQAYGATTMRAEHVTQENGKTVLHFIGKDGVQNHIPIDDERTANELKERAKKGGKLYNTNEKKVLAHLDKLAPGFLVKDLRTVVANETAEKVMREMPAPKTLPDLVKARMEVATKVAAKLGNTPVIALGEYINPERFSRWETSAANNEQANAIEHYAKAKGIDHNAAAKEWIGTHAKAFRENFIQRLESPKKVKAYDDGTQVTGKIGAKGKQAAMALGGRDFSGAGGGNGFDGIRGSALHEGRDSFNGSNRESFRRVDVGGGKTVSVPLMLAFDPNETRDKSGRWAVANAAKVNISPDANMWVREHRQKQQKSADENKKRAAGATHHIKMDGKIIGSIAPIDTPKGPYHVLTFHGETPDKDVKRYYKTIGQSTSFDRAYISARALKPHGSTIEEHVPNPPEIEADDGGPLDFSLSDTEPQSGVRMKNALVLYNHNHDEIGRFTDAEIGSHIQSARAHGASKQAHASGTKKDHQIAAAHHREAADRASENDNEKLAEKHAAMASHHDEAARGKSRMRSLAASDDFREVTIAGGKVVKVPLVLADLGMPHAEAKANFRSAEAHRMSADAHVAGTKDAHHKAYSSHEKAQLAHIDAGKIGEAKMHQGMMNYHRSKMA